MVVAGDIRTEPGSVMPGQKMATGTRIPGRTVFASGLVEPTGDPLFYSSRQPGVQFQIAGQLHDFGFNRIALKDSAGTFLADFEGTPIRQNV